MKKNFSWICKNLLLPLIPFVAGWLVRSLNFGEFSLDYFNPGELSFSMSMLCLIMMLNGKRLSDEDANEIIFTLFFVIMVVFICIFAINTYMQTELYKNYDILIDKLRMNNLFVDDFLSKRESFNKSTSQIWLITLIFSSVSIVLAFLFNLKYKISTHE